MMRLSGLNMLYSSCPFGCCLDKPAFAMQLCIMITCTDSHEGCVCCPSFSAALYRPRAVIFNRQTDPTPRHGICCWLAILKSNMYHRRSWTR